MDETATRRTKIDPKLYAVGWELVPESVILTEQRAYEIAPDRVGLLHRHPKKADYVLEYHGRKLAIIEAKSDEKDVSEGVEQAKLYAEMLQIRYTYACNGDTIWAIDMGVKDAKGNYLVPSKEGPAEKFPSPQELWKMTYPTENIWRDRFNLEPYYRNPQKRLRYYQEVAITNVLNAVANDQKRILLTMATGTGKTYTAFQICWKLFQQGWNVDKSQRKPRILFITDRNTLADQARNDFDNFPEDAMVRVNPKLLHSKKYDGKVPTGRSIYFTIFQTFMQRDDSGMAYYMQYPKNFFDFVIIDECHRGGANDESEWRELMDYFDGAVQLGMTATPKRKENTNTYAYFGEPVYTYSLKQGINDGFLTPFRVKIAKSNIDDYKYEEDDKVVAGDIDKGKTYTESDFYNGNISIRDRDEHRVKELLGQMGVDEKTIVFCAKQSHAAIIRDMINQHKRCPDSNYCMRVTAADGDEGEQQLKYFQDNENLRPTILTTSQKLSTGVDARNVRNIVLLRPIKSIVEFKQIIGRGTRLFDGKNYFTIYDYVGAHENFKDPEWDGDPVCEKCGNWPCTCNKRPSKDIPDKIPQPCPVCGHLPCTCPGGGGVAKKTAVVNLSNTRKLLLSTEWEEKFQYGDELLTIDEFIKRLFGRIPTFFESEEDLRTKWSDPQTRKELLDLLDREGFAEDKLEMLRRMMPEMKESDLLDVLEYIAYNTPAIERAKRVELVKADWLKKKSKEQQAFFGVVLDFYQRNGYKELGMEKLSAFLDYKYHSISDALAMLNLEIADVRNEYLDMQKALYGSKIVVNNLNVFGNAKIDTLIERQINKE